MFNLGLNTQVCKLKWDGDMDKTWENKKHTHTSGASILFQVFIVTVKPFFSISWERES